MNLSIFSFRTELKAIGVALMLLLAVEASIRWFEPNLSVDVNHIRDIPKIVAKVADAKGETLLFLGNSMTRRGVNVKVLTADLKARGVDTKNLTIELIYPDSSGILYWNYLYDYYFKDSKNLPDTLVVSFGKDHLADNTYDYEHVFRIAHQFTTWQDVPKAFQRDFISVSERGDFLLAKVFASFTHRERIRVRLLDELIPHYRSTVRLFNDQANAGAAVSIPQQVFTYDDLQRFLSNIDASKTKVIFIAMPMRDAYHLDPQIDKVIRQNGATFLDLRSIKGLEPSDFRDPFHLIPKGATIYSHALASKLAPLFR